MTMTLTQEMMTILVLALAAAVVVLFILCMMLFIKIGRVKRRYTYFMGTNKRPSRNLEQKLDDYFQISKQIEEKYSKLLDMVTDIDQTFKTQIQKVGLIRYNPFDEMGGNLCFALALLDAEDNGVVLNGIHSRTGSFTYAKPIEMGVSTYMLSDEEMQAVELAKTKAYIPKHEKVVKVRFKPCFRKKHRKAEENQISSQQLEAVKETVRKEEIQNSMEARHREKMDFIGDVTQEERELILREETLAGKIAAAEVILKKREEQKAAVEKVDMDEIAEKMIEGDLAEAALLSKIEAVTFAEVIQQPIHSEVLERDPVLQKTERVGEVV